MRGCNGGREGGERRKEFADGCVFHEAVNVGAETRKRGSGGPILFDARVFTERRIFAYRFTWITTAPGTFLCAASLAFLH